MVIEIVPRLGVDLVWDKVKHLVAKTNDAVLNDRDVLKFLQDGTYVLWVAIDSDTKEIITAMTVEFVLYPRDKVCRVVTIGGSKMSEWIQHITTLEEWAKSLGCSYMDMYGRRGWLKILTDYNEDCILLRKKL
jgi:hypothetical protein